MSSTLSTPVYTPLQDDEIRVLVIQPGEDPAPIACNIMHVSLRDRVLYETMSYAWGDPSPTHSITLHIGDRVSTARVTENLFEALRQFRDIKKYVTLWIDALCINQADIVEKGAQVMRMAEIYNKATNVRVWLGVGNEHTDQAISYLTSLLDKDLIKAEPQDYEGMSSLEKLLSRTWFRRRWVIQEIAFARDASIFCGTKCLSWTDFADSVTTFTDLAPNEMGFEEFGRTGANALIYISNNLFRRDSKGERIVYRLVALEALLQRLNQFQATDSRDFIYAVLTLAKDTYASAEISVDYTKPIWEVYKDAIALIIGQSKSLDVICRPWAAKENDMPSWIQDCSSASFLVNKDGEVARRNADSLVGEFGRSSYRACGSSTAVTASSDFVLHKEPSRILIADGFILDEITTCGENFWRGRIPNDWLEIGGWSDWQSEPPPTAFWRTMVADRDGKGDNPPPWYPRVCHRVFKNSHLVDTSFNTRYMAIRNKRAPMALSFIRRLEATMWNRRLGKTAINRALGVFPSTTEKGDLVCILEGCSVPVVVRRKKESQYSQSEQKSSEVPLGVHIEPYLVQLRSIYAKQDANWDDGFDEDDIVYTDGDVDKEILDSYQQSPRKKKGKGSEEITDDKTCNPGDKASTERTLPQSAARLAEIDFECTLIGECFMYGVMDGEAMEVTRSGGMESLKFGIS